MCSENPLTLFLTHVSKVSREATQVSEQIVVFDAHPCPKSLKVCKYHFDEIQVVACFRVSEELFYYD